MDDLHLYFDPLVSQDDFEKLKSNSFGKSIQLNDGNFPEIEGLQIAIIGVPFTGENEMLNETAFCADAVRPFLYNLSYPFHEIKIADLGNLRCGNSPGETFEALSYVSSELVKNKILPVIIGGTNDLLMGAYLAYEKMKQIVNIVSIDSRFDFGNPSEVIDHENYMGHIIVRNPNYLFNFTNIGFQSYFVDAEAVDMLDKMYFDAIRLGMARNNIEEMEPVIRNADIFAFDFSALRQSDAPAATKISPNGFYGEEACQLTRYAGMSDKLSLAFFSELNPVNDKDGQSTHLLAQMIWYFFEGYSCRKGDFPVADKSLYLKYIVTESPVNRDIVFYRSPFSERWWMEVPGPATGKGNYERHQLVPCSFADYQNALSQNIPERWWAAYQKFSVL